jgi:hypothetical protein
LSVGVYALVISLDVLFGSASSGHLAIAVMMNAAQLVSTVWIATTARELPVEGRPADLPPRAAARDPRRGGGRGRTAIPAIWSRPRRRSDRRGGGAPSAPRRHRGRPGGNRSTKCRSSAAAVGSPCRRWARERWARVPRCRTWRSRRWSTAWTSPVPPAAAHRLRKWPAPLPGDARGRQDHGAGRARPGGCGQSGQPAMFTACRG